MNDIHGRIYAKLSELKPSDTVIVDDGFDCMTKWSERQVYCDSRGELYVPCKSGEHNLEGQLMDADNDSLVGVYRKETFIYIRRRRASR